MSRTAAADLVARRAERAASPPPGLEPGHAPPPGSRLRSSARKRPTVTLSAVEPGCG